MHLRDAVSIHAPLRGATEEGKIHGLDPNVSIHAPLRGATSVTADATISSSGFNPRAPKGRDTTLVVGLMIWPLFQSTRP